MVKKRSETLSVNKVLHDLSKKNGLLQKKSVDIKMHIFNLQSYSYTFDKFGKSKIFKLEKKLDGLSDDTCANGQIRLRSK